MDIQKAIDNLYEKWPDYTAQERKQIKITCLNSPQRKVIKAINYCIGNIPRDKWKAPTPGKIKSLINGIPNDGPRQDCQFTTCESCHNKVNKCTCEMLSSDQTQYLMQYLSKISCMNNNPQAALDALTEYIAKSERAGHDLGEELMMGLADTKRDLEDKIKLQQSQER